MPHGLNNPVGRVFELDGQIFMLGIGHDANTTIHLAEALAGVRYRRPKSVVIIKAGQPMRFDEAVFVFTAPSVRWVAGSEVDRSR